jgi:hypothetical protein
LLKKYLFNIFKFPKNLFKVQNPPRNTKTTKTLPISITFARALHTQTSSQPHHNSFVLPESFHIFGLISLHAASAERGHGDGKNFSRSPYDDC